MFLTAVAPVGVAYSLPVPGLPPVPGETVTGPPGPAAVAAAPVAIAPGSTVTCTTKVAKAPSLAKVRTSLVAAHGYPFGLVTPSRGHRAFISLLTGRGASVGIFQTRSFAPELIRPVRLPASDSMLGDTLTPDGRYLLGATSNGLVVISVARAERGSKHAILGTLSAPRGQGGIEVAVSRDGRYAFVSLEYSYDLAVFNLHQALTQGFSKSDLVGTIPTGAAPVGLAVSPSGRYLYSTSEQSLHGHTTQGTLSVISVARAEHDPARSVLSTVYSGCGPVRVVTSRSGSVVWVTARESDALLAFSAARLRSDPGRLRLADVRVGEAPVGLDLVNAGRRIVVADSNRFDAPGEKASLGVVSVAAALHHQQALLGYLRAGQFPRQMALEPGGRTLLVGNFSSQQLEAVDVAELP
jgi:6-phosphogluconolactonase (cycloisomerase 2 family)